MVARGEVCWLELEEEGRRPVDNLRTVPRALLTEPITKLDPGRMEAVCWALANSAGC